MASDSTNPNVLDLIRSALNAGPVDQGHHAYVYDFPKNVPGMDHYLLRVDKTVDLNALLTHTTSLTPLKCMISGIYMGQPLMELEGTQEKVTILARQSGESLQNIVDRYDAKKPFAQLEAYTTLMEKVNALAQAGTNPFTEIFQIACDSGASGNRIDFRLGNIFLDEAHGKLALVDQVMPEYSTDPKGRLRYQKDEFLKCFSHFDMEALRAESFGEQALAARYENACAQFTDLTESAFSAVYFKHQPMPFACALVHDVKAVKLHEPSHTLLERLQSLESRGTVPRRS